ncbi:MAG: hypothetical protein MI861_21455 [Pirellulales bacterium]|nr:hypothetical protein [Pirellulales bacterium]
MTNSQRLALVRDRLRQWIADQGDSSASEGNDPSLANPIRNESILIRDGFYCGRRFDLGAYRAVWFLEEDQLKIYARGGDLVCVLLGADIETTPAEDHRSAATIVQMPVSEDRSEDHPGDEIRRAA